MNAPHLTRRLVLEEMERIADGAGGFVASWVTRGTLWADLRAASGRDATGEEVVLAAVTSKITVRGAPQGAASRPKPGQRFRDGVRAFDILAVTEADPAGRYLTCFAREEGPI
ncbi:head-tail adaptor protein [Gemmobacter serpentinus]|uniref:head-tail adaptor protein n=1 Tax=Gemmobacter serpentinus TaxID=2652247 RepID=UPI00124E37B6|nr:head-tail adaptor protein [Gemmobacter serpentinus]